MPPDAHDERRPDPDALLALTGDGRRGKLKVFLGAAPGVGKTYAMLQGARRLKADGIDVVIGLVETHGRSETAALLEGLDVLPRRMVEYRGRSIEEFDLDAALARRPGLIVVDELAHTNAPESRHPKRWQDVEELLDAGVDVWTALNVQHLESLADVVSRVTGVAVRETVPDNVLQTAQDVILVDITPAELIQRLQEGKVYMPQTARRAVQNFFTPSNLTALRELALRRTADRVDDQMVNYLRQNAIEGPWETSEYLLVCIGADDRAEILVRTASRMATRLNASWVVVHVERQGHEETDPARLKRIDEALQLAERLGAQTQRLSASDMVAEVLRYARRENATQIVLGRSRAGFLRRRFGGSFSDEMVIRSDDIAVHVVTTPADKAPRAAFRWTRPQPKRVFPGFLAAVFAVAAAVGVGEALTHFLDLPNLSMVFLLAVLACSAFYGLWSAVAASFLSFLAYNFFFIPPLYTFTIAEPQELLSLLAFLAVAVLTGSLAGRAHDQAEAVRQRAQHSESLYDFSRKLAGAAKLDDVLWAAAAHLQKIVGGAVVFLIPEDGDLQVSIAWPPDVELNEGEMSAARWAFSKNEIAGWHTDTLPTLARQFRPLVTPRGAVGVLGFEPMARGAAPTPEVERALTSILEQTALAVDRSLLVGEAVRAAALEDNEKLRTTLLSSLSHDLRTPLATIAGAISTLRQLRDRLSPEKTEELLESAEEETERLTRFIANLLDMSRIESGALKARQDYIDPIDCIRNAVERGRKAFGAQTIETSLAPELPFIRGDAQLLEQVLFNLLDNAHKYGGGSTAMVHARREGEHAVISVTDEGPGIKPADLTRVFEKFYRGGKADGRKAGTGLGLSICKGLVEAMGGTIEAQSPAVRRRGTRIVLRFPVAQIKERLPA
ncbi:sensor histidine kinase KdpD [Rhodoblastus acidophilus]|uniref:histidine kinase n=1 Tax=Candidatus Rhodoblastus alkanivorans TaxID=2954117 RepID=A0ABS9Z816_9HYPH|nr:sensor histidine kinase KdpD [Candidatus Rhodoblastus alkanivorans]MCI4678327.1 sensor histidine kinase KdpD [Candidatus Rhodoblastus alkanivorans]MCI4683585.1 sensor histidine kinase KdpD [Candidatus Rhodoblastus alkanivorans]MDI4640901.1 sensor histidine kinase KdpD [Rhodoblastus acidophilus]